MTATEQLQQRLAAMPADEREAMAAQILNEWETLEWDRQIETDVKIGKLERIAQESADEAQARVAETIDALRAFRKGLTLGDVTIRELIEEGRI